MILVSGLVLTSILLYAIRWFSGPNLGSYKNLLTTFAVTDLFLIVLHGVVRPVSMCAFERYNSVSIVENGAGWNNSRRLNRYNRRR